MKPTRALPILLVAASACGPQFYMRDRAERDLRKRASFEMDCPAEQVVLTPLSSEWALYRGKETDAPKTMGAAGCGKKGTYVYMPDKGYVLNSTSIAQAD